MPDLTRRWFLFGAAATVALPVLPSIAEIGGKVLVPEPVVWPGGWRAIHEIGMYCLEPYQEDVLMNVHVLREVPGEGAFCFMHLGMNNRSHLLWRAAIDGEMIIPAGQRLRLDVDPALDGMRIDCVSRDARGVCRNETYEWKDDKIVSTYVRLDRESQDAGASERADA